VDAVLPLLLTTLVLFAPYLVVAGAFRGRLLPIDLALAAPASILMLGWFGIVLSVLGVRFGVRSCALLLALLVVAGLTTRVILRRRQPEARRHRTPLTRSAVLSSALGVAVAATISITIRHSTPNWVRGIPEYVDDLWHGYVIGLIARIGEASPWELSRLDPAQASPTDYYPYGLHLVGALTSSSITPAEALNSVGIVAGAIVAAIGMVALAREVFGVTWIALVTAPIVLSLIGVWQVTLIGIPAFSLGTALIPGTAAAVLRAQRLGWPRTAIVTSAMAVAGVWIAQPAAVFSLAVVLLPAGALGLISAVRSRSDAPWLAAAARAAAGPAVLGSVVLLLALPWIIGPLTKAGSALAALQPTRHSPADAILDVVTLGTPSGLSAVLLGLLAIAGLVLCLARQAPTWPAVSWLLAVALFVVSAVGSDTVRKSLTGVWFGDYYRLQSVVALLSALLATGAVVVAFRRLPRRWLVVGTVALAVAVAIQALIVVPSYQGLSSRRLAGARVTSNDMRAYRWVAKNAKPGERAINDWKDGSTWGYSFYGTPITMPYITTVITDPARQYLMEHLPELGTNLQVDRELRALNIHWAIVDSTTISSGVLDFPVVLPTTSPYVRLAYRSGVTEVFAIDVAALPV
jgi:hypothetical protein